MSDSQPQRLATSLYGKIVVFVGTMSIKRSEAVKLAKDAGAAVAVAISGKTEVLVVGAGAQSKMTEAKNKGIDVVGEADFLKLLNVSKAAPPTTDSKRTRPADEESSSACGTEQHPRQRTCKESSAASSINSIDTVDIDLEDSRAAIKKALKGKTAVHVRVTNLKQKPAIPREFLAENACIESVDLSQLAGVKKVGYAFLYNCTGLKLIDLAPLASVKEIDGYCLSDCTGLQTIDLTPFSGVTVIDHGFLVRCSGLQRITLKQACSWKLIRNGFLLACKGLKTFDLAPLSGVEEIGDSFLQDCTGLESLNLSPLAGVKKIGDRFLEGCHGLQTVDASSFQHAFARSQR